MLSVVATSVAAIGPTGVAFQIHQTVATFHKTNVSNDQPKTRHQSRRESPYESLIHNSGTNPTRVVKPLNPSHPNESSTTAVNTAINLRDIFILYQIWCKFNLFSLTMQRIYSFSSIFNPS